MALLREKTDLQSQLDDNEEELSEVMKKFKAAVQQVRNPAAPSEIVAG